MTRIPEDVEVSGIPPSFVTVTQELRNAVENSTLPTHVMSTFENGAMLPYPLVIHPALDIAAKTLQRSLQTIYESHWNLHTLEATYTESIRAFDAINTSLFSDPQDTVQKCLAFVRNIEELRRLYLRHSALVHSCQWIAITLIGPYWLSGFKEVCHYLAQTVERIPIKKDVAILVLARRLSTSVNGLLLRYTHSEIEKAALLQRKKPGESLYRSLEAWEFVSSEIAMGSILGEGGFATVRSCEWFGGAAAVKTFHQESSPAKRGTTTLTTENMSTYLHRRELEVWYRLAHPNVLPFLGACLTGSTPMILTPLSENGNARSYRSRNLVPGLILGHQLFEIVLGVEFLHKEAKIVHGDLKGANILINSKTSPQIADFGLAKMTENIYGHREFIGGTAQWMAPELLDRSGYLTYASDIYSLGMTLYELWYNKDPFELLEPDLVQEMVLEEELRPERESSPVILDELWSTIEGCWPTKPESRLSAPAVVDRLKAYA
ncbi:hypothetical protein FRC00_011306, partial [Tulasnella sp. 408]